MVVLTLSAWLYCRHFPQGKYPIKILGPVPRGFKHVGTPDIDPALVSALASQLPVATIILLLEHIAISKCMSPFPSSPWLPLIRPISIPASLWPHKQLQDRPQPGANRHRCHKYRRNLLRCLPRYRLLLAFGTQIQVWCQDSNRRYIYRHRRHRRSLWLDRRFLLDPHRRPRRSHHPRRR